MTGFEMRVEQVYTTWLQERAKHGWQGGTDSGHDAACILLNDPEKYASKSVEELTKIFWGICKQRKRDIVRSEISRSAREIKWTKVNKRVEDCIYNIEGDVVADSALLVEAKIIWERLSPAEQVKLLKEAGLLPKRNRKSTPQKPAPVAV